jgi:hypothetical protein
VHRPRRSSAAAAACALVGGAAAAAILGPAAQASSTTTPGQLTFSVPRVVDPIRDYGEPGIAINPATGAVHVSGPMGTGVQRSGWDVSTDGGLSFREVSALPEGTPSSVPSKSAIGAGGGDTDVAFAENYDQKTATGYFTDLWALQCNTAAVTPDDGATVTSSPAGCSHPPDDRPWYAVFDPSPDQAATETSPYYLAQKAAGNTNPDGTLKTPLLYVTYNDLTFGAQLDQSTNGLTFTPSGSGPDAQDSPPGVYGDQAPDTSANTVTNNDTPIVIDQQTGDVLTMVDNSAGGLDLAVGVPDANGYPTWTYSVMTPPLAGSAGTLFPVLAEDSARNLYAAWVENCGVGGSTPQISNDECFTVRFSHAPASDWTKWSAPVSITPPGHTAVMPWIAAGGPGIVDVVWYDTASRTDPSYVESTPPGRPWYPYLAQITGADTSTPVIALAAESDHPTHYNSICLQGTGCVTSKGDRNLADFFAVAIGNDGRAYTAYADTSNVLIQPLFTTVPTSEGFVDHDGAEQDTLSIQSTGVNAWTGQPLQPLDESWAPVSSITNPTGHALANKALGGTEDQSLDIKSVDVSGGSSAMKVAVTTVGGSLAQGAQAADSPYGQLTLRWQMGNTLYYATAQEDATGQTSPAWSAGPVSSIDLCSVSACDPHYFVYGGPDNGGTAITGTVANNSDGTTTYTFQIPFSVVGQPENAPLLDQFMAFTSVSAQSNDVPVTNPEAEVETGLPTVIDATRDFNTSVSSPSGGTVPEVPLAALLPVLAATLAGGVAWRRRSQRAAG